MQCPGRIHACHRCPCNVARCTYIYKPGRKEHQKRKLAIIMAAVWYVSQGRLVTTTRRNHGKADSSARERLSLTISTGCGFKDVPARDWTLNMLNVVKLRKTYPQVCMSIKSANTLSPYTCASVVVFWLSTSMLIGVPKTPCIHGNLR